MESSLPLKNFQNHPSCTPSTNPNTTYEKNLHSLKSESRWWERRCFSIRGIDMYENSSVLGSFTSLYCRPNETAWPYQIPVFFESASQLCMLIGSIGFWYDDFGMLTKLHGLVWEHQGWCCVRHIEKALSLTHYETLTTLIGYCIIANQWWYNNWI